MSNSSRDSLENTKNLKQFQVLDEYLKLLEDNKCTFIELVDFLKTQHDFAEFLRNIYFFRYLIQNNLVAAEQIKYLFCSIQSMTELYRVNNYLISYAVHNQLLVDDKVLDSWNSIIQNAEDWSKDCKDIFDFLALRYPFESAIYSQDFELSHIISDLKQISQKDRLDLFNFCKKSEQFTEKLKYIVDNQLENRFDDLRELKTYLSKEDKKVFLNI